MADDDLLRSVLEREARQVPMQRDAAHALVALEPALRRAAFKRASLIAASTVLVFGGTAAAFNVVRPTDDEISVVSPVTSTLEPGASTTVQPGSTSDDDGVTTSLDGESTIHSPIEVSGDDAAEHTAPDSIASTTPTTPTDPTTSAPPVPITTQRPTGGATPPAPATTPAPTSPPATTPMPTPPSATTAPPGQQLTRYDTTCGSVLADLATTPPTIVEVVVAAGYRYRIEEPDGNSITVQFTGPSEDCEVKVGTPPDAGHAERSVPDESSSD